MRSEVPAPLPHLYIPEAKPGTSSEIVDAIVAEAGVRREPENTGKVYCSGMSFSFLERNIEACGCKSSTTVTPDELIAIYHQDAADHLSFIAYYAKLNLQSYS